MNKNSKSLIGLMLLDLAFDLAFLQSLGIINVDVQEDDTDSHPLIGRRYKVGDNSYIKDKETGLEGGLYGREVIIVSDPYVEEADTFGGVKREHLFVDVFSTDSARKYRVLFNEGWLIDEK